MSTQVKSDRLIVPVYINEKIVLDMLAIMEDGFSMVSQVNYSEQKESNSAQKAGADVSTSATLLSKLLKINLSGELSHAGSTGENKNVTTEKVHTNVSLLSKFRSFLIERKFLKQDYNISEIEIGDFIEVEGELQKNPLINYMELLLDVIRLAEIFADKPQLGNKTQAKNQKQQENETVKQIKSFTAELMHSGTIDFILSGANGTAVLSAQEQYLSNDNISEILGGRFKVLGKVIAICRSEDESIDLLRKTTLSILPKNLLEELFSGLQGEGMQAFNLPELVTEIAGPAMIVIPVAIYA